jgi:hypothetical protein
MQPAAKPSASGSSALKALTNMKLGTATAACGMLVSSDLQGQQEVWNVSISGEMQGGSEADTNMRLGTATVACGMLVSSDLQDGAHYTVFRQAAGKAQACVQAGNNTRSIASQWSEA